MGVQISWDFQTQSLQSLSQFKSELDLCTSFSSIFLSVLFLSINPYPLTHILACIFPFDISHNGGGNERPSVCLISRGFR